MIGCRTMPFIIAASSWSSVAVTFFYRAFTAEQPIVDLFAFKNLNFAFGSAFSFVLGIGLYGLTYVYPVYLGQIRGYDALMIGEALFVSGLCMFLTAPVAGFLSGRMDPRIMIMIGFLGFGAGTWTMTHLTADWDFHELLIPQIFRGVSLMLCMVPINNLALGTLPPCPAEECLRPFQPHAQPRRCRRAWLSSTRSSPIAARSTMRALRKRALGQPGSGGHDGKSMSKNFASHGLDGQSDRT